MSKLPHPASCRNHSAMQPWTVEFVPAHFPLPSTSYMYTSNLQLYRSVARDNSIWADRMAPPHGKPWQPSSPLWGRRRAPSDSQDSQQNPMSTNPARQLRRSVSAASPPVTPAQSAASADSSLQLQSPPASHIRRRPTRLSSLIRRHHTTSDTYTASAEPKPQYVAYTPNPSAPSLRSAPSAVTSFPVAEARGTTFQDTQSPSTASPVLYDSPQSEPVSTTTPYRSTTADPWQSAIPPNRGPFPTTDPDWTTSPVSFVSPLSPQPSTARAEAFRGFTSSTYPGQMARSVSNPPEPQRRDSETAADTFESPLDFALFAEATSSLSIGGMSDAPFVRRPTPTGRVTPSRLDAPLPPVPQQDALRAAPPSMSALPQTRAQSLPPRQAEPQVLTVRSSRTQLAAEALLGLNVNDPEDLAGSEDELPDYAQSQLEANARQRWEATQRARELDEAWRRGRRNRGA